MSGCAGVVAGVVVFFHERLDNVVAQSVLVFLLATVILLTGLAHVLGGPGPATNSSADLPARASCSECWRSRSGFSSWSLENSRAAYWAAVIWALTGGVILIGDALLLRRRLRSQSRHPGHGTPEKDSR